VTIVHGVSQLLNGAYPDKVRKALERSLRKRGIKLIFNEYIDKIPGPGLSHVRTRSGKSITADLVVSFGFNYPQRYQLTGC
jgi:hypothetical protein